jgi:hypothetical protein
LAVASVALIGFGSAVFHPEATRGALASGRRFGFAQSTFRSGVMPGKRWDRCWRRSSWCRAGKARSPGSHWRRLPASDPRLGRALVHGAPTGGREPAKGQR